MPRLFVEIVSHVLGGIMTDICYFSFSHYLVSSQATKLNFHGLQLSGLAYFWLWQHLQ